jgi:hypothetical protein
MVSFTTGEEKLSTDELKVGYWYVTHRLLIRRIAIMLLALFDAICILISIYIFIDYYIISRPQVLQMHNQMTAPKMNYAYLAEAGAPQGLALNFSQAFRLKSGKYDLVAEVQNINTIWQASMLKYHFEAINFSSEPRTDYILPGQTKYLMNLGLTTESAIGDVDLVIDEIKWEKVTDFDKWRDKVFNIQIIEPQFLAPSASGVSDQESVSRVTFKVLNDSAYNYWDVDLKVLMLRNEDLVGVNDVPLHILNSGEEKTIEFLLYDQILIPNKVTVVADVNILDPAVFKGFDGVGEPK